MRELTASQITSDALILLKAFNYRVRRVNNVGAYKKRANQVQAGWPDIQGYSEDGKVVLVEVKKKGDTLKKDQRERLQDCVKCGGIALIASEWFGETRLTDFQNYAVYS